MGSNRLAFQSVSERKGLVKMPDLFTIRTQFTENKTSAYGIVAIKNVPSILLVFCFFFQYDNEVRRSKKDFKLQYSFLNDVLFSELAIYAIHLEGEIFFY